MTGVLLSLGHGYCAAALAGDLLAKGWRVAGTYRADGGAERLRAAGVMPLDWNDAPALASALVGATHLLSSIAPGQAGDPALEALGEAVAEARHLAWIGYLSSTAVYGDHGGGWVDENTPPTPTGARGKARLLAEQGWQAVAARAGAPCHIFRLSGIYGPGRAPFDRLRSGQARRIVKPGQVFSRVHVDDIAQALAASMAAPTPGGAVWNLADDLPAPPQDVTAFAAELIGLDPPPEEPFDPASLSPMARSFFDDSRRVSNARVKRDLGLRLKHPDYRAGLQSILSAETAPR